MDSQLWDLIDRPIPDYRELYKRAEMDLAAALAVLRSVEWAENEAFHESYRFCPSCESSTGKHKPTCPLAACLSGNPPEMVPAWWKKMAGELADACRETENVLGGHNYSPYERACKMCHAALARYDAGPDADSASDDHRPGSASEVNDGIL